MEKGLSLTQKYEGLKIGTKKNGVQYSVRDYRNKYFFPDEWLQLMKLPKDDKRFLYEFLMMTGARVEEALCVRVNHIRWDRNYLTLYTTKVKAKKKETKPTPRDITFSSEFSKHLKRYILSSELSDNNYLFLDNSKIYDTRKELRKQTHSKYISIYKNFRRILKQSKINEPWNYSIHNIRKTHGMYLKCLDVKFEEICKRMGHDYNTYLKHYGSADIFNRQDKVLMQKILGDVIK